MKEPAWSFISRSRDLEGVLETVAAFWDLTTPFPVPKYPLTCGVCSSQSVIVRQYRFFRHRKKEHPCRVDVSMKCRNCSHTWFHGLVVPADYWTERREKYGKLTFRRDAEKIFEEEGYL